MPLKRRRTIQQRKQTKQSHLQFIYLQTSDEKFLKKIDSDLRTIPDQTFGKIYSTQKISNSQILEQISSPNPSTMMESEIMITSMKKTKQNKSMKKKENMRKLS